MATTIKLKNSVVKGKIPSSSDLVIGEVAVGAHNETPALFFKDNADNIIKIEPGSGVVPSPDPPSSPSEGDLWYNENTNSLNYWNGTAWVELGQAGDSPVTSVNGEVGAVVLDATDVGAATAAQGALADTALQPTDNISELTNDAGYLTSTDLIEEIGDGSLELPFVPLGSWADIPPLAPVGPGRRPILNRN